MSFQTLNTYLTHPNFGILALSFQTLKIHFQTFEFWPFPLKHSKTDLAPPNFGILAYILPNIGTPLFLLTFNFSYIWIFILSFETSLLFSYPPEHWNSHPILIIIRNLILSSKTVEFFSYPFKHWNSDCILLNIWIHLKSLEFLSYSSNSQEFLSYLSKHWNSCLIFPNIGILINVYKYAVPTFLTCSQWLNSGGTREVRLDVSM